MSKTELMKVVLECDDEIEEEDLHRFEFQGKLIWEDLYWTTWKEVNDAEDDGIAVDIDKMFKANLAKLNILNMNEYDYYDIIIDESGTFTLKCRLKYR